MNRQRILSISFSPLATDARVQRQLRSLASHGQVTSVGYGPAPVIVQNHIEVPASAASLPQTVSGVTRLGFHLHKSVELKSPGERAVLDAVDATDNWDLVVANDARAIPLAFRAARGAPVWVDLHEWAPEENATSLPWRTLVGPYMDHLCRRYLSDAAAITTVGNEIAELYSQRYGIPKPEIIRNAGPYLNLSPTQPEEGRIRLVHSGIAVPERNIEALIDATLALDEKFTLDLYLIGKTAYLSRLRARAAGSDRVRFCDPVHTSKLPATLNQYDLGVYLLEVRSTNHRLMLPNKFFDFVQARLGLVFGPSIETSRLINERKLGVVTAGWHYMDLVDALRGLTTDDIVQHKTAANAAAEDLSSATDLKTQEELISGLLGSSPA